MFLRVYFWLYLTVDTATSTLTQLGLSTFLNEFGFSGLVPNKSLEDCSTSVYYKTQPLLVYDTSSNPHFYTLEELMIGVIDTSLITTSNARSSERTVLSDQAYFLQQVSMWCFSPGSTGLDIDLSATGIVAPLSTSASTADALALAATYYGLQYGRFGYCDTWFTGDVFVALSLGVGGAALVSCVVLLIVAVVKTVKSIRSGSSATSEAASSAPAAAPAATAS
jgi:hypothetical protein